MSSAPAPDMNTQAQWRLTQIVADTYERSKLGGLLYLFGWFVVALFGQMHQRAPGWALAIGIGLLLVGVWRWAYRPPGVADPERLRAYLRSYGLAMLLSPAIWVVAQVWLLRDPRFDDTTQTVALIATIGYCTVFANVYVTTRILAATGVAIMFLPTLVALWSDPRHLAMAVTMTLYGVYLVGAVLRSHADYRRRLRLDQQLREQSDRYEWLSRVDPLTGLYNRRFFAAKLDESVLQAQRGEAVLMLMIMDVDHFKRINDRYGHAAGDACLAGLAGRLQKAFDGSDALLARLGGEEFGILMYGGSESEALAHAEAFRQDLEATPLSVEAQPLTVTVSVGVGVFDAARDGDGDGLYREVDQALYRAKDLGRNRVQRVASAEAK
ncbi:GGDEF domain-containing protein [Arenimonas sp.]|uniref:GGDEF domain-containing protein n=1 Tax=Arenimonas sp. TaxID=1872635 RepID=UPI0039E2DE37